MDDYLCAKHKIIQITGDSLFQNYWSISKGKGLNIAVNTEESTAKKRKVLVSQLYPVLPQDDSKYYIRWTVGPQCKKKGKWRQVCSQYIIKYHTMSVMNKELTVMEKQKKGP